MANLLVVEDDPDIAEALGSLLTLLGHQVRIAADGEQGLRRLWEQVPDLVLMDVEMPRLTGPGMAARMLAHDAGLEKVPVAFLSGAPKLREIAADLGTPYFLGKPYPVELLVALVDRALRDRAPPAFHGTSVPGGSPPSLA